ALGRLRLHARLAFSQVMGGAVQRSVRLTPRALGFAREALDRRVEVLQGLILFLGLALEILLGLVESVGEWLKSLAGERVVCPLHVGHHRPRLLLDVGRGVLDLVARSADRLLL